MAGHLTIVSCGLVPDDLKEDHKLAVAGSTVLAGGKRLLDWFPGFKGEKIIIAANAHDTAKKIAELAKMERVAVLASGDALFFGIAELFLKLVPNDILTIIPNITSAQAGMARLKIAWSSASFFSVHGRDKVLLWPAILRATPAVIYTDPIRSPASVAMEIIKHYPEAKERNATVLENIGCSDEKIVEGTLEYISILKTSSLAILVIFGSKEENAVSVPGLRLGLNDDEYDHERGLITHSEVRSIVLSKLGLRPGVMWDVGAGSGSVGIEACGLCPGINVYSIESKPERCDDIKQNATKAGCQTVIVLNGEALDIIKSLPAPHCVFIGGGGSNIKNIVEECFEHLLPGGRLIVSAIMLETRSSLLNLLPDSRVEVLEVSIKRSRVIGKGLMLSPDNPVNLFVYRKRAL